MQELPVVQPAAERADAARNRAKILCAARELFEERGVANVSMDDIAARAGVGKGTLFRRFGDRASLARSVLDATETRFQDALIRGAPPLGPGAPPCERLIAFGEGLIDHHSEHADLLLAAEASGRWMRSPVYASYHAHVAQLVGRAEPALDPGYAAEAILSMLRADLLYHQRTVQGLTCGELKANFRGLVSRLLS